MKKLLFLLILISFIQCHKNEKSGSASKDSKTLESRNINSEDLINKNGLTLKDRVLPPKGFQLITEKPESFGGFIQNFKLKPFGSPILKYDGSEISIQNLHIAVLDIDTELQICNSAQMQSFVCEQNIFIKLKNLMISNFTSQAAIYFLGTITKVAFVLL